MEEGGHGLKVASCFLFRGLFVLFFLTSSGWPGACASLGSKFPRSELGQASVRCAGETNPIRRGPTSQLTGLEGSASNSSRYHSTHSEIL